MWDGRTRQRRDHPALREVPQVARAGVLMYGGAMKWAAAMICLAIGCAQQPAGDLSVKPVTAAQLLEAVRAPGAKAVLVNVYATWCEPCRKEFPDLVKLERSYRDKGLRLLFVSADDEDNLPAVKEFLAKQGVAFPTYLKAQKDMEFINSMEPRWDGSLPVTLLYDSAGRQRDFWVGMKDYKTFEEKLKPILEEKQ
jgi:thiol-disulfide isomerase/thioredoxin